jgi:hypothetical protein
MTATDENKHYAIHMYRWIESLDQPKVEVALESLAALRAFWFTGTAVDLQALQEKLWTWVDANGGPCSSNDRGMLFVRLVLCLAYEDNHELRDMGFFDDLLANWGISRSEINKQGARHSTGGI